MTKNIFENCLKIYGVFIAPVLAMIPFMLALLMTLFFTMGDVKETIYIMMKAGVVNIWLQGLVISGDVLIQLGLVLTIVLSFILRKRSNTYKLLLTMSLCVAFFIMHIPNVLLGIVVIGMAVLKKRQSSKQANDKVGVSDALPTNNVILLIIVTILLAVVSYPYTPVATVYLENHSKVTGYTLGGDTSELLLYDRGSHRIRIIEKSAIKSQDLCMQEDIAYFSFASKTIAGVVLNRPYIINC